MAYRWHARLALACALCGAARAGQAAEASAEKLLAELRACRFKIIHESFRNGNWELVIRNADGSAPVNLTRTPNIDEMFPHASPDGTKVVFIADEGRRSRRTRNVYWMHIDGSGRFRVGRNGRQPFWSPDGKRIAFATGTTRSARDGGYENRGLRFFNIETREYSRHPRKDIGGLLNPCWSPDGRWIITSVIDGMHMPHSVAAINLREARVVELARGHWEHGRKLRNIYQCRPDISPDGRHIAWGKDDLDNRLGFGRRAMFIEVVDIDLAAPEPGPANPRHVVSAKSPMETYHVDWSPDGQFIAYSHGARGSRMQGSRYILGARAPGWNIWVVKPTEPGVTVQITHDGLSNKEPDWVVVGPEKEKADR